jgi:eukaryotic-like serine/threonine-protein kinase
MTRDKADENGKAMRLEEDLLAYVEERRAGRLPSRSELLAAHPEDRRELEEFFAGHDEVERLAAALREPAARVEQPLSAGAIGTLGDFRLLREVGRGGMGVVYEAEQMSLRRRVALKVLPFVAAADPRQLQRFKNEAMAAAHLRHEHIVPVHAVGEERGVHYYAMQFVEGRSLAALIAELQAPVASAAGGDATPLAAALSTERSSGSCRYYDWVARLGMQAAAALEHAHSVGIVHRDIKPANLLLDHEGRLWISDFGLAQIAGDAGLTFTGELLGTLRYASPEQVLARRGVVDHRSDVYSLGATLYELLTLRPLVEGRDRNELLRQIADDEPRLPRSADPSVPRELETVVLKALGKEPSDRYPSARDLADDLQRFLDRRPVVARRRTIADRLRQQVRRHPTFVAAGAAVLGLLLAGSLLSMLLIRGEQQRTLLEQQKAEEAYRRERQRAEEAEARFRLARRSVDEMLRISQEELADRPGLEGLRKRILWSVLAHYTEFIGQRKDDPRDQAELLEAKVRVEKILADLSVLRAASQLYLLCQAAVLDDLRLSAEQRRKVGAFCVRVGKEWKESLGEVGQRSAAERGRRAIERARAYEIEVKALLAPAQQARLRQIGLQAEGPGAFGEPEVMAELGLTPAQREQIRTIEGELLFAWMHGPWPAGEAGKARKKSPTERILAILTDEQRERWRTLTGDTMHGTLTPFPPQPSGTPPSARESEHGES